MSNGFLELELLGKEKARAWSDACLNMNLRCRYWQTEKDPVWIQKPL